MAHVGGIGTDSGDEGPLFSQRCERPVDALPHFAGGDLLFEPGTQYRYSNYGWILVSGAIEAAAGEPFFTVMQDRVFGPLGMQHTGTDSVTTENPEHAGEPSGDAPFLTFVRQVILEPLGVGGVKGKSAADKALEASRRASLYFPRFGADPTYGLHAMRPHNLSCYAGSMAFFSTPSDLVRFALAMNAGKLLRPDTVRLLQAPQQLASEEETGYGLGWDLEHVKVLGVPATAIGHDGAMLGGTVMSLMALREPGIVVAVMSNISYADTPALALKVAEAFAATDGVPGSGASVPQRP
jgi:CubicO group peptidase (beta-lactamase class C family)